MIRRNIFTHSAYVLNGARTPRANAILSAEVQSLLAQLHVEMENERQELLRLRKLRQQEFDAGKLPGFVEEHPAQNHVWQVAPIPEDLKDRRVEITGPANSAKMVINMLSENSTGHVAQMAMIDMEDSMKPSWNNVVEGIHNIMGAAKGDLEYVRSATSAAPEKTYRLNPEKQAHMMVRVRGLHLDEANVLVGGQKISAGVFDLALSVFHTAKTLLAKGVTPKYYVPKCEHYLEARWWNRLFILLEKKLDLPRGSLRVTFLIETLPAAFQMEEILYEIRERACGLNGGRWDKIFSDIKVLRRHADRVSPDRSSINMERPWMDNYAKRLIKICHKHGAFAMGGMSAFTPGKDAELRRQQTEKVAADKNREATIGHDGCWVSHPYFIGIAQEQFQHKNQLGVTLEHFAERPELLPQDVGPRTLQGLRTNIRVGIAYQQGWNTDIGCVSFDNLMEDLATLEISRAQVWQWRHHGVKLDEGMKVTTKLVEQIFLEEFAKILSELEVELTRTGKIELFGKYEESYFKAMEDARALFLEEELADFLCTTSEPEMETGGQDERRDSGTSDQVGV